MLVNLSVGECVRCNDDRHHEVGDGFSLKL